MSRHNETLENLKSHHARIFPIAGSHENNKLFILNVILILYVINIISC